MKEKILVFVDWYEPGFRGGGPIRSCVNFAMQMRNDYDVFVFTRDRDLGMNEAYENIIADNWLQKDGINVFYASPSQLSWNNIVLLLKDKVPPDYIYVNGIFSKFFSLYPVLIYWVYKLKCKCVVAPRGMLKATALKFKKHKKIVFLKLLRFLGVYNKITFQATDNTEFLDVKKMFGQDINVHLIPNFSAASTKWNKPTSKESNSLKIIFVGRAHPIKNLFLILEWLPKVGGEIWFTIVITDENEDYWKKCKDLIQRSLPSIKITIQKNVPNQLVQKLIAEHHVLALPTEGENFGHVIFEALSSGIPVIISDQTPWRQLEEKRAGWDISLSEPEKFIEAFRKVASWTQIELDEWSYGAWSLAKRYAEDENIKTSYLMLFNNQ